MPYHRAILDFRQARRQAERERRAARMRGRSADLLSYEQVRHSLKTGAGRAVGLRDIPLAAIVGSVDRYADFTRSFLPLRDEDEQRWARVQTRATEMEGLPPIEVYQIGQVYFVRDGNHRVSVARRLGATHIQAHVTEVDSRVALTPDLEPGDLILKAEHAAFLEETQLDRVRPEADLSVSAAGQFPRLLAQIEGHRTVLGLDWQRDVSGEEAVGHWYDEVYTPVARIIRSQDLLCHFPGRTEADLYLWLTEHRDELEKDLGWEIGPQMAALDLVERFGPGMQRRLARTAARLADLVIPDELESGPAPGTWRQTRQGRHSDDCLFSDILVPVRGRERDWAAVAQAAEIACRETARMLGLHLVPTRAALETEEVRALGAEFARQIAGLGTRGRLAVEVGPVARRICERSHWADLVVVGLAHRPAPGPLARLGPGLRTLVRRCPTPLLVVPQTFSALSRLLLAYDGSAKAREALFIAAYLASRGRAPLTVLVVEAEAPLAEARAYLDARQVAATYERGSGPVARAILDAARTHDSDLILMGGYGRSPVVDAWRGSVVDEVLRSTVCPVLVGR